MKYFDAHTHLNIDPLIQEQDELVKQYIENEIGINIVGVDLNTSKIAIQQSRLSDNFVCSIGIHPCDILDDTLVDETINALEQMYLENQDKVKCIGECGLDLYHDDSKLESQILWFKKQIELCIKYKLVLMIHVRDAHEQLIEVLKQYMPFEIKVIIHCYNKGIELANTYIDMGCYLSIPGVVTYKNASELQDAIKQVDLSKIITETDAPYLSPTPMRGKVNNSNYLIYTNTYIASLRNMDLDEFNNIMKENALKIFFN